MTPHRPGKIGLRTLQASSALLAVVLLGGCGESAEPEGMSFPSAQNAQSSAATGTESPADPPTSSTPALPPGTPQPDPPQESTRCHTSMLSGSLERGEPGAGQRYAELVLRNTSSETCTLYGYGGLQLIGQNGEALPTNLERVPSPGPELLRLAPGDTASATLHWTVVPHGDEPTDGPCQPAPVRAAVIPPDETAPLDVTWDFGPVCGGGSLSGSAYHR